MRRGDFDHVIAAAADVTGETELVVIGSQAILGPFPDAPESMLRSMEADLYPRRAPEKADDIDGSLGDGSRFHRTYGYYAHGVGPETAKAPAGWEARLIAVEIAARISSGSGSSRCASSLTTWCSRSASQGASEIGSSPGKRSSTTSWTRRCSSAGSTICRWTRSTATTFVCASKRRPVLNLR